MWAEFCSHCGQNLGAAWSKHFYWYTSSHFLKICCSAKSRYPLCSQKFTKNSDRNHSKPLSTLTIFDWSLSKLGSFKNFFRNLLRIPLPSQPLTKFLLKLRNEKHNALFQFPLFFFFTVQVFRSKFVSALQMFCMLFLQSYVCQPNPQTTLCNINSLKPVIQKRQFNAVFTVFQKGFLHVFVCNFWK